MNAVQQFGSQTFSSLSIRNYRLYAAGQAVSLNGTWAQTVAQGLLVLQITDSGTALGLVTALQTLPVLVLGPWGGLIADRFPKRSILYATQVASSVLSLSLGLLVALDRVEIWMVFLLALGIGVVNAVDNPTRQTFVHEMVGKEQLANAVSLNSAEMNVARVIGPTVAGILAASVGLAACFLFNGVSYIAVIASLRAMREQELQPAPRLARGKGQLADAVRYVRSSPVLLSILLMMAVIGTFTYEFMVSLPMLAERAFDSGAQGYAALTSSLGAGAVVGGLYTARRKSGDTRRLIVNALLFGILVLAVSQMPTLPLAMLALVCTGFFSVSFSAISNVMLQTATAPEMRGRVMGLWTMAFLGSTPIGAPTIGWIGENIGPRWALGVGGVAAITAAGLGFMLLNRAAESTRQVAA